MAARICPHCIRVVPAARVLAFSDGMECPHCQASLEVATGSRMLAVTAGLAAGWLAWRLTRDSASSLWFALPVLFSILAFGIVSPLVLLLTAALCPAPAAPTPEPAEASHATHAHGSAHH